MDFEDSLHSRPRGLCGLANIGNTCYMNSALQSLSNCHQLTSYFLKTNTIPPSVENTPQTVAKCYRDLIKNMWSKKRPKQLTPSQLMRAIRIHNPTFRGYAQQDTQEFLRCLMDRLHEELKQPTPDFSSQTQNFNHSDDEDDVLHSNRKLLGGNSISEESQIDFDVERNATKRAQKRLSRSASSSKGNKGEKEEKKEDIKYRSIITDVFDGKLLSSVQCLTCNRVSNTVETFQDLSLPIPTKEDLSHIHTQAVVSCAPQVYDDTGWIFYIWEWMKSWFVGPEIQLQDCLSAFFTRDELKGDNMYNCEKCKKLRNGIKFSSVQIVPEVLCIHLKRFRQELFSSSKINTYISFPMTNLDIRQFISKDCAKSKVSTKYDLTAVICHFGSVGGGHYIAYAKNCINNQWYEYNDSFVNEVPESTVASAEVYVLFYSLKDEKSEKFRKSINHQINIEKDNLNENENRIAYISREWLDRFNSCVKPGPISNYELLCRHGAISLDSYAQFSELLVPVSIGIYQTLIQRYSGGPNINSLDACPLCQELEERKELELNMFKKLHDRFDEEEKSVDVTYRISLAWFEMWQAFVEGRQEDPPGRIDNLLKLKGKSDTDSYGVISKETWKFFHNLYGGGPALPIDSVETSQTEIEDEEMPSNDSTDL